MKKWFLYTGLLGFAAYWASNLILWFPWSYSATLGMTLMLTLVPLLWGYVSFLALQTYPSNDLLKGAAVVALVLLLLAVIMDYIFFGHIRNAMEELYHPTTFYGYGFLLVWPVLLALLLKKKLSKQKKTIAQTDLIQVGISGMICFLILASIVVLGNDI